MPAQTAPQEHCQLLQEDMVWRVRGATNAGDPAQVIFRYTPVQKPGKGSIVLVQLPVSGLLKLHKDIGVYISRVLVAAGSALSQITRLRGAAIRIPEVQMLGQVVEAELAQGRTGHAFQKLWVVMWQLINRSLKTRMRQAWSLFCFQWGSRWLGRAPNFACCTSSIGLHARLRITAWHKVIITVFKAAFIGWRGSRCGTRHAPARRPHKQAAARSEKAEDVR